MINSIPGYNVTKIDKNRYAVSVKNGNNGAVLMNKEQYKQFAAENGVRVNDHKGLKVVGVLAGIAGVVAAVIYRKDIAKFVQGLDFKGKYDKIKTYVTNKFDKVKNVYKKDGFKGVWDKVVTKGKKIWTSIKDFFKNHFADNLSNIKSKTQKPKRVGKSPKVNKPPKK